MSYFSPNSLSNVSVTNDGTFLGQTGWFNCGLTGSIVGNVTILNNELTVTNSNIDLLAGTVSSGNLSVDVRNVVLPVSNVYLSNLSNLSNLDAKQSDVLSNIITTNEYLLIMKNGISGNQYQCNITNTSIVVNNSNIDVIASTVLNGNVKVNVQNALIPISNVALNNLANLNIALSDVPVSINGNIALSNSNLAVLSGGVSAGKYQCNITNTSLEVTGAFYQATQPISGTVTVTGVSTSANQLLTNSNLSVLANCVSSSNVNVLIPRTLTTNFGYAYWTISSIIQITYGTWFLDANTLTLVGSNPPTLTKSSALSYIPKDAVVSISWNYIQLNSSGAYLLPAGSTDGTISNAFPIGNGCLLNNNTAFSNTQPGTTFYGLPCRYIGVHNWVGSTLSNLKVMIYWTY